jgi:hypothetical protein
MTKIELALARFRELPPEDQEAIAEIILGFGDSVDDFELTPEQIAEIERRAAEPDGELFTTEQVMARLKLRQE